MELCLPRVHRSIPQGTKDQQYNHTKLLQEFQEEHSQTFRNKFFSSGHRLSTIRNHTICTHSGLNTIYVGHDNILRFYVSMSNLVFM